MNVIESQAVILNKVEVIVNSDAKMNVVVYLNVTVIVIIKVEVKLN